MKKLYHMIHEAGVHANGRITRKAGAPLRSDTFVKLGSTPDYVVPCGDGEKPFGISQNDCDNAQEVLTVCTVNAQGTKLLRLEAACAAGDELVTAADGKAKPLGAGGGYVCARALNDGAAGELVECETFYPVNKQ
jgi:hypothetical protein